MLNSPFYLPPPNPVTSEKKLTNSCRLKIISTKCFVIKKGLFGKKKGLQPRAHRQGSPVHTVACVPGRRKRLREEKLGP